MPRGGQRRQDKVAQRIGIARQTDKQKLSNSRIVRQGQRTLLVTGPHQSGPVDHRAVPRVTGRMGRLAYRPGCPPTAGAAVGAAAPAASLQFSPTAAGAAVLLAHHEQAAAEEDDLTNNCVGIMCLYRRNDRKNRLRGGQSHHRRDCQTPAERWPSRAGDAHYNSEGDDEPVGSRFCPGSDVSHMIRRASTQRGVCLRLALTSLLLGASPAVAQQEPPQSIIRLGGATRFTAPVNDISALTATMGRAAIQADLATVLEAASMPGVTMDVQHRLAMGQVTAATLPPGTVLEWMALRRAGPEVVRNIRWDGEAPLQGFEFTVDDLSETYTFFVPAICGNLALVGRQPSLEAARRAEVARLAAAREDAARAAAQEAARLAAEYEAALEAQRAAVAAAAEQERLEAEREAGEQARLAAEQTQAEYSAALERDLRVRPVLAGFFGKQQRQYDDTDPAGLGRLPREVPRLLDVDSLLVVKGGVVVKLAEHVVFAPAVGAAVNIDEPKRTSLFADAEIDVLFGPGAYVGTGVTVRDLTHSDSVTAGVLLTAGVPVWKSAARMDQLLFSVEYRYLYAPLSDPDVNYQFWGGLKYVYR